ncbi:hypothetical protein [Chromobacterium violaceum]|uniref:hypothetical protein n=1 Tax=Chromobacterium violaceum TaxID=536 RepID=UPI0009DAA409|nr:hypothetical protein [Chromobacterium violaceum]OQS44621.1 hypothetical protein B0T48_21705 [Chromobacterium violaceum]OQS45355.1 hypothetical protein B0T49_21590 [Chromobacterium violaceum]QRO31236.1 hypothetical protein I6K04_11880 [Chromobacterium violaceum]QRQ18963.1 hypothetical protein I6K03_10850 [Chromobacterium violaceum]
MWRTLGLFGGVTIGWWALLWLVLPQSWQRISPSAILMLHLGPPMLLSAGFRLWSYLKEKRAADEAQQQEEQAEAERNDKREAARAQHAAELRERQRAVGCRWLWTAAAPAKDEPAWLAEMADGAHWLALDKDEVEAGEAMDALSPHLSEMLSGLYAEAPGAAWLPLYLEPMRQVPGVEQLTRVKELKQLAVAETLGGDVHVGGDCRFLPGSGQLADRVLQVLQQDPELPGLVVLAADAPLAERDDDEDWGEVDPELSKRRSWMGEPGIAVVAMLFLRDGLVAPAEPEQEAEDADPYQPYWEKDFAGPAAGWGIVPPSQQASLARLPKLAILSQSSSVSLAQDKALHLARSLQPVLDNALVNAALLDYPFSPEEAKPENNQASSLAWLCHNSGQIDVGGVRLAAIATALSRHQVELHPIDEASNVVREWGDAGAATPMLLAAAAVSHCARLQAPAVITHFHDELVSLAMARPPAEEATA